MASTIGPYKKSVFSAPSTNIPYSGGKVQSLLNNINFRDLGQGGVTPGVSTSITPNITSTTTSTTTQP